MKHNRFLLPVLLSIIMLASCNQPSTADGVQRTTCSPPESPRQEGYYSKPVPPAGFHAALGWLQALEDSDRGGASRVEVDWMRLHAMVDGKDTIIASEEFDRVTINMSYYGVYRRSPWFEGDKLGAMPFTMRDG